MKRICPAKINLYLKILGRRNDGFHELETVFQTIDLADELHWLKSSEPIQVTVTGGPDFGDKNLVRQAITLYADMAQVLPQGHVVLTKKIPIGGGLGGGSSNAAAMLEMLNDHYKKLSRVQLHSLGLQLGSDVPFFLERGCQWGYGRGEDLESCGWRLSNDGGFLIIPSFGVATAEVFKALCAGPQIPGRSKNQIPNETYLGKNDLEVPACKVAPALGLLLKQLRERLRGDIVFMSGSGSTLVWLTAEKQPPEDVISLLDEKKVRFVPFTFI